MAAPMSSENMSNPSSDEESYETNLLSPNFNPLKALYSSKVQLPFPQATIFNNLAEYERIVTSGDREGRDHDRGGGRENEAGGGRSSPSGRMVQCREGPKMQEESSQRQRDLRPNISRSSDTRTRGRGKDEHISLGTGFRATQDMLIDSWKYKPTIFRNVITRMSEFSSGPLSVLYRCMNERCKVRICTRSFKGLRSICIGYLVTFDKFYNMALVDVDEVWRRPSTGQRFYHEEKLTFSKIMECSRMQEPQQLLKSNKSKTQHTEELNQTRKEAKVAEKQPQVPQRHHTDKSAKDSSSVSRREERRHSEKGSHGESRERSRKDHREKSSRRDTKGKSERHKSTRKDSLTSKERSTEGASDEQDGDGSDADIEDLQKRLAALQRELTSLSDDDDDDAEGSSRIVGEKEEKDDPETRLAALYRELTSLSDDDEGSLQMKEKINQDKDLAVKTETRDSQSRIGERADVYRTLVKGSIGVTEGQEIGQSTKGDSSMVKGEYLSQDNRTLVEGSTEVTQRERSKVEGYDDEEHGNSVTGKTKELKGHTKCGTGESSKVDCTENEPNVSIKRGRLKIKQEEFQRRHVNQLFIRGDNVVLVSVDSNLLPK